MGSVALDETDVSETSQENSGIESDVSSSQEPVAKPDEQQALPLGDPEAEGVSGELGEETKPVVEETPKPVDKEMFRVGDKEYTREQAERELQRVSYYQSDRDKTEATLERLVKQLATQGLIVDKNLNITKAPPQVNKRELAERAVSGDVDALTTLLDVHGQEVAGSVSQNSVKFERAKEIHNHIQKNYPGMYDDKGRPNMENPITIEAARIVSENPALGSLEYLPTVAELAQSRLLKTNIKGVEQRIKNEAQRKFNKTSSSTTASPTAPVEKGATTQLSEAEIRVAKKFGESPDRIAKIIERANKEGGYYL